MVANFPASVIDSAWKEIPREWLEDDEESLEKLLEALLKRREQVPRLIREARDGRTSAFRNWR
jgi:hypothetical protein